jgi:hypothetical protein
VHHVVLYGWLAASTAFHPLPCILRWRYHAGAGRFSLSWQPVDASHTSSSRFSYSSIGVHAGANWRPAIHGLRSRRIRSWTACCQPATWR